MPGSKCRRLCWHKRTTSWNKSKLSVLWKVPVPAQAVTAAAKIAGGQWKQGAPAGEEPAVPPPFKPLAASAIAVVVPSYVGRNRCDLHHDIHLLQPWRG